MKINIYFIKLVLPLLVFSQSCYGAASENGLFKYGETLTSTQLVTAVLQANPRLEVAQATWQASLARAEQQASFDDPQFQYSFAPLTADSRKPNGQALDFGQRFVVSQKLPFPGKLSARAKVAEYQAQIKQQDIVSLQLLLATKAKVLFSDWYFIHQAHAINKNHQNLLVESREIALTRYSTGLASQHESLQIEMDQALLKHQDIVLKRQRTTILAQLNTLLNLAPRTSLPVPRTPTEINDLPDLQQLQNQALRSRPELKAIAASISAHRNQIKLTALNFYPDLKLSAGYNSLWDNEDKRFNIGVSINIPLDQSKRRAAEQEAKANSHQAHWQKIDLQAKIREELAVAYAYVEESLHVLRLYRQQLLPLADEHRAAAKADYRSGKGDFLTLINREKNTLKTQLQTAQALADAHRRYAELERAVGRLEPLSAVNLVESNKP